MRVFTFLKHSGICVIRFAVTCGPQLNILPIKPRRIRWAGRVAHIGEKGNSYSFFVGKPEGNGPLRRSRRRREANVQMYREYEWRA